MRCRVIKGDDGEIRAVFPEPAKSSEEFDRWVAEGRFEPGPRRCIDAETGEEFTLMSRRLCE
jgi:hypothetical protein